MKNLVIVGAAGFGREVLLYALGIMKVKKEFEIKGFIDDNLQALDGYKYDYKILSAIDDYEICEDDVFICTIGDVNIKKRICEGLLNRGAEFINLIHPTAIVGFSSTMGIGNIMAPYSVITQDVKIGDFVTINCSSGCGHDAEVGDFCTICSGCDITGAVKLKECVFLGSNVSISPKIVVGRGARVGAGSVVIKNVKENTAVFGNPAKEIF